MKPPTKPRAARQIRLLAILLGIVLLAWVSLEDQSVTWALLFAAAICMLVAAEWLASSQRLSTGNGWLAYPLAGLVGGVATAPIALLLMAIKTGLHGHAVPDYTPAQMGLVLTSIPIWIGAGALIGLGVGIWFKNR
jgi:hypothetical protein